MRSLLVMPLICVLIMSLMSNSAAAGPMDRTDELQPDIYPSQESAGMGLAKRVMSLLYVSKEFDQEKSQVVVTGEVDAESLAGFVQTLSDEFPSLCIQSNPGARRAGTGDSEIISIRMQLSEQSKVPSPFRTRRELSKGMVRLTISGGAVGRGEQILTARYIDKPWVDDWSSFANSETKGRWIRGQNEFPLPKREEALEKARQAAAKALWPRVQQQMNARNAGRPGAIMVKEAWVRSKLESLLRQDKHVADTFVQTYERSFGKVYQASILVDASSDDIDEMALYCAKLARAEFGNKAITLGSMAGMIGVIVLLYFFVNAVTKGYFVWRLRAVAMLLGIAGILVVLAVT